MTLTTIRLRDKNTAVFEAWQRFFTDVAGVEISHGGIFDESATAIVSPANSFGFMDGGIDLAYTQHFGWDLQKRLQERIRNEHFCDLPVGQAIVVETHNEEIPYLVSAPTMRIPMNVSDTLNAYLAFRAALIAVQEFNASNPELPITSILCPGLCTASGGMAANDCAKQMAHAHARVMLKQQFCPRGLGWAIAEHMTLLEGP